jgi:hypothetical protein
MFFKLLVAGSELVADSESVPRPGLLSSVFGQACLGVSMQ